MPRYRLTLEYDGGPFLGWQRQAEGASVQGALEDAIEKLSAERVTVTGAGRTWNEKFPSDSGKLGAPNPGLSDRNGPSDPDAKRDR